jgi:hypothetical protein
VASQVNRHRPRPHGAGGGGAIEQGRRDLGLPSPSPRQPAGAAQSAELAESLLQVVGVHYRHDLHIGVERHEERLAVFDCLDSGLDPATVSAARDG